MFYGKFWVDLNLILPPCVDSWLGLSSSTDLRKPEALATRAMSVT